MLQLTFQPIIFFFKSAWPQPLETKLT